MLQSQSRNVVMYLRRAQQARDHARNATLKSELAFYVRIEERWMSLAASTAFAERVDLFLLTVKDAVLPHDTCTHCRGVMTTEVLEATGCREIYTLRCCECGGTEWRTVMRYTMRDKPLGAGVGTATHPLHAAQPT